MYTQCPNCDTHFEITQEYLDMANGKVRCGQCEHIFNALENLYEQTPETDPPTKSVDESPEQEQTENLPSSDSSIDAPPKPSFTGYTASTPSIDIKAKMERIAASLSAATQELKSARESNTFRESTFLNTDIPGLNKESQKESFSDSFSTSKTETPPVVKPESGVDNLEFAEPEPTVDDLDVAEPEPTVDDLDVTEPEPTVDDLDVAVPEPTVDDLDVIEPEPTVDDLDVAEPEPTVNDLDVIEPEPTVDDLDVAEPEPTVDDLDVAEPEPTVDDLDVTEPGPTVDDLDVAEPEPTVDDLDVTESSDNLDLMDDFEDNNDEEIAPLTDFTTRKVDQDDIDILNSLIDSPAIQEQQTSRNDELLDELDSLNMTLSDEDSSLDDTISLDDELSGGNNEEFDDLDNGDDLLAELEQLEKDFIDNGQIPSQPSYEEDTQEANVTEAITEDASPTSTPPSEEEVVPSFLTQEGSTSSNPKAMFGWLAGTIVLLVVLATQYLHVNSIKLAQNTTFRPLLESLCPMTGCALPLQRAPRKIVTVNHDVRTHASINRALEIQVTFKNKASFIQAYPELEIIFSNPRGEIIARRRFIPDEYLTGDIQHAYGMKPNQSQDVKLKIVDPDPGALLSFQFNYY